MAYCTACKTELRAHVQDLKAHRKTEKHARNMQPSPTAHEQRQLQRFVVSQPRVASNRTEVKIAELRLAAHIAVHGSLAAADHVTPLISNCFRDSTVASSLSMGRTKCTALVNKVLGPTLKQLLLDELRDCKFSLILDESTDVSSTKELAVVARFYSSESNGIATAFLGLVEVQDASSAGLFCHLKGFIDKCNLDLSDCVGIGTDGASVMCGIHNSLYTRMKEVNSNLVLVKCVCHSLHLACNEAVDALPTQIDYIVRETFNWFSHSPKRQDVYKNIYAAINPGLTPKKLIGVCTTRWLSIAGALRVIRDQWLELKTHFDAVRAAERCYLAKMLSEMYNDDQNFLYVQFLTPIVDQFDKLNKVFQSDDPDPSKLFKDLSSFVECLLHRIVLPGHASIDCDWESHVMHVRACQLGSVFRDALEKSSLSDERKTTILERCRAFMIACVKSTLKRLPSNMKLLGDLNLLH